MMKINAYSQAQLIKLLLEGTRTCTELAEATGLHVLTVYQYTRELHRAGVAYIAMWEKDARGRDSTRVYQLGAGVDAKREKLTGAERQGQTRARKKAAQMSQVMAGGARFVQAANGRLRFEVAA